MIYEDSVERSTEYLRQAIPLMSRQAAALHPVSYAVWYDYVSSRNLKLRAAIDECLARDGHLDEASTTLLFQKFVAEIDPQTSQRIADGFHHLLSTMAASAAEVGEETTRFGSSLTKLAEQLDSDASVSRPVLIDVLADTRKMGTAMAQLQVRLEESQSEITLLREEVRRARHESLIDSLTGLANRRAFDQQMSSCLTAVELGSSTAMPCLVVSDIDHFKRINDDYGHNFGDQVLRTIGKVLQVCSPEKGVTARIGGEEFAILLPESGLSEAHTLAEKIRKAVANCGIRRSDTRETLAQVTLSLGVTLHRPGESARDFLERADHAMYSSKKAGRDRVTVAPV